MALTGQAKTDYQREYMRKRRSNGRDAKALDQVDSVRPEQSIPVRPHSCAGCKQLTYRPGVGMRCLHGTVATSIQSIFENEVNPEHDCTELTDSRQAAEPIGAIQ